jgi:hypothetical protein
MRHMGPKRERRPSPIRAWEKWVAGGMFAVWFVGAGSGIEPENALAFDLYLFVPVAWWVSMVIRKSRFHKSQKSTTDS